MDEQFLRLAIERAGDSVAQGGFPAGSVLVRDGVVVGEGISLGTSLNDPTSHGEVAAIRAACRGLGVSDLSGSVLYSSLEPCLMCFGASLWSAVSRIVFACSAKKVLAAYYGGRYSLSAINADLIRPIELVHCTALENDSLVIIRSFEESASLHGRID